MPKRSVVVLQESLGSLLLLRALLLNEEFRITHCLISTEVLPGSKGIAALWRLVARGKALFLLHRLFDRLAGTCLAVVLGRLRPSLACTVRRLCQQNRIAVSDGSVGAVTPFLADSQPEVLWSLYYNRILPSSAVSGDHLSVNVHPALLPQYRGLFPDFWALYNREAVAGITVHLMRPEVDAGPCVAQRECAVGPADSVLDVYYAVTLHGAGLLRDMTYGSLVAASNDDDTAPSGRDPINGWPSNAEYRRFIRAGRRCVRPIRHVRVLWTLLNGHDPFLA